MSVGSAGCGSGSDFLDRFGEAETRRLDASAEVDVACYPTRASPTHIERCTDAMRTYQIASSEFAGAVAASGVPRFLDDARRDCVRSANAAPLAIERLIRAVQQSDRKAARTHDESLSEGEFTPGCDLLSDEGFERSGDRSDQIIRTLLISLGILLGLAIVVSALGALLARGEAQTSSDSWPTAGSPEDETAVPPSVRESMALIARNLDAIRQPQPAAHRVVWIFVAAAVGASLQALTTRLFG